MQPALCPLSANDSVPQRGESEGRQFPKLTMASLAKQSAQWLNPVPIRCSRDPRPRVLRRLLLSRSPVTPPRQLEAAGGKRAGPGKSLDPQVKLNA
eukprot:5843167-Pyramimonas_sp.AAC.1